MAAAKYDFVSNGCDGTPLEVGATFSYQLIWEIETPVDSNIYAPVDLTGYTGKMQVRMSAGSPVILELSTTNGRITFDALNGIINLVVPASVTAPIVANVYRYDLDLIDGNGFVTRFIQGLFEVVAGITS